jgi:small subunit ribosomal protein S1
MTEDPWIRAIPEKYIPGHIIKGKVTKLTNFGAFVELETDLEGLLHISELADHKIDKPQDVVKTGDEVEVKILKVDTESRKIGLSLRRVQWAAEEQEEQAAVPYQLSLGSRLIGAPEPAEPGKQAAEAGEPEPAEAGEPEPADAGEPEPAEAGEPEPAEAGEPEAAEAGEPEPADAGEPEAADAVTHAPDTRVEEAKVFDAEAQTRKVPAESEPAEAEQTQQNTGEETQAGGDSSAEEKTEVDADN